MKKRFFSLLIFMLTALGCTAFASQHLDSKKERIMTQQDDLKKQLRTKVAEIRASLRKIEEKAVEARTITEEATYIELSQKKQELEEALDEIDAETVYEKALKKWDSVTDKLSEYSKQLWMSAQDQASKFNNGAQKAYFEEAKKIKNKWSNIKDWFNQ